MRHRIDLLYRDILLNLEPAPDHAIGTRIAERFGVTGPVRAAHLAMELEDIAENPENLEEDREYARERLNSIPF